MRIGEQDDAADQPPWWQRRELTRTALAGTAAPLALPLVGDPAQAQATGPIVTLNPIKARIAKSGVGAELVDFSTPPRTSAVRPHALINFLYHAGDGSGRSRRDAGAGERVRRSGGPTRAVRAGARSVASR